VTARPPGSLVRVVHVDDQPLLRAGLSHVLSEVREIKIVGQASRVAAGRQLVLDLAPDIVVTEIGRGRDDGLSFITWVRTHRPMVRIVALSARPADVYAERALRAGALGFVSKTEGLGGVLSAIRAVMAGRLHVPTAIAQHMLASSINGNGGKVQVGVGQGCEIGVEALSDRELQVFELIGLGRSTKFIARALHISEKTVASHRSNIKDKLNLGGLGELIRRAVLWSDGERTHESGGASAG